MKSHFKLHCEITLLQLTFNKRNNTPCFFFSETFAQNLLLPRLVLRRLSKSYDGANSEWILSMNYFTKRSIIDVSSWIQVSKSWPFCFDDLQKFYKEISCKTIALIKLRFRLREVDIIHFYPINVQMILFFYSSGTFLKLPSLPNKFYSLVLYWNTVANTGATWRTFQPQAWKTKTVFSLENVFFSPKKHFSYILG